MSPASFLSRTLTIGLRYKPYDEGYPCRGRSARRMMSSLSHRTHRNWTMCHSELLRIREICDCVVKRGVAGHYFENFDRSLAAYPIKRKHFLHLEAGLADLKGRLGTESVLCEVKTINPSDDEVNARSQMTARSVQGDLPQEFFNKLTSTLKTASTQMDAYCQNAASRKFIYVILNFDDNFQEYVERYMMQLRDFCATADLPCVEIVFDVKPKFYSATSESPPSQLFVCRGPGGRRKHIGRLQE
jgi:hypothetical protein